jgi:acetolactate synthase-1/3 small subunit
MEKRIISLLLEDRFGALSRVVELFGSRGYNLHSVCSGESREEGLQRLTLVCFENEKNIQKIVKLLQNIIYVYEAKLVEQDKAILRELILIKIKREDQKDQELFKAIEKQKAKILIKNKDFICFEYLGDGQEIDEVLKYFRDFYKIIEVSRTGEAALDYK